MGLYDFSFDNPSPPARRRKPKKGNHMLDNSNLAKLKAIASAIAPDTEGTLTSFAEERARQEEQAEEIVAEMRKRIYADFQNERKEYYAYVRDTRFDSPREKAQEIECFERAWDDELTHALAALRPRPPRSQSAPKRRWTF